MSRSWQAPLGWFVLASLIVACDQFSKWLALRWLTPYEPWPIVPGFNLTLVYNPGAAFSFLSTADGWQRWFFLALAVGVSVWLSVWLVRLRKGLVILPMALSLILGGAIGNAIDRVLHGHVIDFIQLYYQQWYWPAFNAADSAITVGAAVFLWLSIRGQER
ncbi:MAG: signal peptidase II [Pseudomonadota bacterium]|nr:signal peptidase II [Pseudomonadota bacterium]